MSISQIPAQFNINGVIDTTSPVFQNMERIANNSGAWITYDVHNGAWSVVINQAGSSTHSFTDSNIIGTISINGTGITDMYNSVKVSYPRSDINDQIDFVKIEIDSADRKENEQDNTLEMTLDLCSDPVQAQHIGIRELKQSRVDLVINFSTDYTAININAGDVIDITNSHLGWTNKLFRVMTLTEIDSGDGGIGIDVTALEYDSGVYDNDLSRVSISTANGIVTKGYVGTPATPTITLFERDARPHVLFETTTPIGIVEAIEFWTSSDGTNYNIAGTTRPFDQGLYNATTAVSLELDNISAGSIYVKVRAINDEATGEFSSIANATYAPIQIPDAVTELTELQDSSTAGLLTGAGLSTLLVLLDGLMTDSDDSSGSVYDKIFDVFNTDVGSDPRFPQTYMSEAGGSPIVHAFQTGFWTVNNAYLNSTTYSLSSFTAPYTGHYKIKYNANWGGGSGSGSPATGEMGSKNTGITSNKLLVNQGIDISVTGGYSSKFEDHMVEGIVSATVGDTVTVGIEVEHNYPTGTYDTGLGVQCEISLFDYSLYSGITIADD